MDANVSAGIRERLRDGGRSRQMHDHVGIGGLLVQRVSVTDVCVERLAGAGGSGEAAPGWSGETTDVRARCRQALDHMPADEPAAARDQCSHWCAQATRRGCGRDSTIWQKMRSML